MRLVCALCMYDPHHVGPEDRPLEAREAITVVEGYATCEQHESYLTRGPNFCAVLRRLEDS